MRLLVAASLLLFQSTLYAAGAVTREPICKDIYAHSAAQDDSGKSDPAVIGEHEHAQAIEDIFGDEPDLGVAADIMNKQARDAIELVLENTAEAKAQTTEWFRSIRARQLKENNMTIMEHSALTHLLRSGFLSELND
jgi:hypothetical protein